MEAKLQQQTSQKAQTNKPNLTGIPTQMKLDFERQSGLSFDDVRVHYNSDKPAQLQALAYTQGTQVYVGPGQERHLPHELGHVVQQKCEDIKADIVYRGIPISTSQKLERLANEGLANYQVKERTWKYPQYAHTSAVQLCPRGTSRKGRGVSFDQFWIDMDKEVAQKENEDEKKRNEASKPPIKRRKTRQKYKEKLDFTADRVATFYTYCYAKPGTIANATQGPHTVAHKYIRLLLDKESWFEIYKNLIEPYDIKSIQEILSKELGLMSLDTADGDIIDKSAATKKFKRYEEYVRTYESIYNFLKGFQNNLKDVDNNRKANKPITEIEKICGESMMAIIEMHPYASYGWNRSWLNEGKGSTSIEIFGKGESGIDLEEKSSLKIAIDENAYFENMDAYFDFLKTRFYFMDLETDFGINVSTLISNRTENIQKTYKKYVIIFMKLVNLLEIDRPSVEECFKELDFFNEEKDFKIVCNLFKKFQPLFSENLTQILTQIKLFQIMYNDIVPNHSNLLQLIAFGIDTLGYKLNRSRPNERQFRYIKSKIEGVPI